MAELKKQNMVQEEAIGQWIEAMDDKKRVLIEKERRIIELKGEVDVVNGRYQRQVEDLEGKVKEQEIVILELRNGKVHLEEEVTRLKLEIDLSRKEGETTQRLSG